MTLAPHDLREESAGIGRPLRHRGCRFIAGDPQDIHAHGEAIFCGKPVAREGGSWCAEHEVVVFTTMEAIKEARKAA